MFLRTSSSQLYMLPDFGGVHDTLHLDCALLVRTEGVTKSIVYIVLQKVCASIFRRSMLLLLESGVEQATIGDSTSVQRVYRPSPWT
jgi:hypothetical protein